MLFVTPNKQCQNTAKKMYATYCCYKKPANTNAYIQI